MARRATISRVGILVECGRDGLEVHLCRKICSLLRNNHGANFEEVIVPMDNKNRLLEEGATTVARLLAEGCERVVLWDEEPAWPDMKTPLCWYRERNRVLEDLRSAHIPSDSVHLVCIERACESWLLSDADLLARVLSRPTHRVRVKAPANPHTLRNAKGVLMSMFRKHGQRYVDVIWAARFAEALNDLHRLLRCSTFRRFAERVIGRTL
jgi:hypothetical protein